MKDEIFIEINESWCKGCEICVDVCPKHVLAMRDFVAKVENIEDCTGCLLCEQLCPDFAIEVHVPDKKKKSASV